MPALASPVTDERSALREYLAFHQSAFFAVAYGLTDEQARSCPTVSALSIGGLVKHAAGVQRSWMARVAAAPDAPPRETRPFDEIAKDFADQHVMRPDETLDGLLSALQAENAKSLCTWWTPPTWTSKCRSPTTSRGFRRILTPGRCGG